jgi:hypothetical protein
VFRKSAAGAFVTGAADWDVPADYLNSDSFNYTDGSGFKQFLLMKDLSFVQAYEPDTAVTGGPRYYASKTDGTFLVSPAPDDTYATELEYYYRPASLTSMADDETTWLSINAENTLLAGALHEAYIFMKGSEDVLKMYADAHREGIMSMKSYGESKQIRDMFRTGLVVRDRT